MQHGGPRGLHGILCLASNGHSDRWPGHNSIFESRGPAGKRGIKFAAEYRILFTANAVGNPSSVLHITLLGFVESPLQSLRDILVADMAILSRPFNYRGCRSSTWCCRVFGPFWKSALSSNRPSDRRAT